MACVPERACGLWAALLLAAILPWPALAAPGTAHALQCWTDDHGQHACGDSLPPAEARRQRELLNPRGVVTAVRPAEKTAAQVAEENRQFEEQKRKDAHDRYLMQSFADVGEMARARDDRLAALDARLAFARKALADNTSALTDLRQREQAGPPEGESLDTSLKRRIREFDQARADNLSTIERIGQERSALSEQFERDVVRYQSLRESSKASAPP